MATCLHGRRTLKATREQACGHSRGAIGGFNSHSRGRDAIETECTGNGATNNLLFFRGLDLETATNQPSSCRALGAKVPILPGKIRLGCSVAVLMAVRFQLLCI